jgi:cytochrome c-type biogenesis protein CcmH/NrfG
VRAKTTVVVLVAALLLYLALLGQRGVLLISSGQGPIAVLLGVGVLIVPLVVAWAVVRELLFGRTTEVMARELEEAGRLPVDDLPRTPGGRVERSAADAAFAAYQAETESDPDDWGGWFRLACAYDVAGDRKRARAAMRHAVRLHAGAPPDQRAA